MTSGPLGLALLLGGAFVAVLLLAALAHRLGLGADERLRDPEVARAIAETADCRFRPTVIALDRAGLGALLADPAGRVMLVRRHGARFLARPLTSHAGVQLERQFLRFAPVEPGVAPLTLDLGPAAQLWAARLRHLGAAPA